MDHRTEIKPGVKVDMADYGRQPDTHPTDMSDLTRNLAKARQSVAAKGLFAPKKGRPPRNRLFNTDGPEAA